jgi:hypothetical protein
MGYRPSWEAYRRRRQRTALKRRGAQALEIPSACRSERGEVRVLPLVVEPAETALGELLWGLACRVTAYPGVRGMLYRRAGEKILVWIVAPCPMTRPLRLLASTWSRELAQADPSHLWALRVTHEEPNADSLRCLFWRGT